MFLTLPLGAELQNPERSRNVNRSQRRIQLLVAAPLFFTTSTHVFRKLLTMFRAAVCALTVRNIRRTRSFRPLFCTGGRPASRSARSFCRNHRLTQDQHFSTGLKSGDLGGICQRVTRARRCAALLSGAFKKLSLSQRTRHGPSVFFGCAERHAATNLPEFTTFTHSCVSTFFHRWYVTRPKPPRPIPPHIGTALL